MLRQPDRGKNGPAWQTVGTASRRHREPLARATSSAKSLRGRERKYPYWWRGHRPTRASGQRCGTPTCLCHGARQNHPPNQVSQGEAPLGNLVFTPPCIMDGRAAGEVPPVIRNRLGTSRRSRCRPLTNASGGSFQNPPTRPFGCLHNIAHLGLPRQGAGSQDGRSDGCVGQCFAPAGAGAIRRDGAE